MFNECYKWNPVYKFVFAVKEAYLNKFKNVDYNEHVVNGKTITCFEYWVRKLDDKEINDIVRYIQFNQKDKLLLVRYANYSDVLSGEEEVTLDDVWNMYDGFYLECRSIVFDLEKEKIVIAPFKKFRNIDECPENSIENIRKEIENSLFFEFTNKLDGSMQCATFYDGKIIMSGSQAIDAEKSWRLKDGYRMLEENPNYIQMIKEFPTYTFIFEYISLLDAHVVKYTKEEEGLYLIGIRGNDNGYQSPYWLVKTIASSFDVRYTQIYNKTLEDVLKDAKTMQSYEKEGFVLNIVNKDGTSRLVKIKGDSYVQLHKIISKISSINVILRAITDNTVDDLKAKIPSAYRSRINTLEKITRDFIKRQNRIVSEYYDAADKTDKKSFMLWVENNVPKAYRSYVRNMYLEIPNNYLKSHSNSNAPKYVKLVDMGIKREDYAKIFADE